MRYYLIVLSLILLLGLPWFSVNYPDQMQNLKLSIAYFVDQIAAVVMHNPRTIAGLQSKYNVATSRRQEKIRILLVPGHEPSYGGAEFGSIKERDLNVELANDLEQILANNSKYQVLVTRSTTAWSPEFSDYFSNSWQNIIDWVKVYQQESLKLISVNSTNGKPRIYHNTAPRNVALRLYGITKWSNEHNIDIAIHIHFNDNPGHSSNTPGKYSGFTIYVPEKNYMNSTTTQAIAQTVYERLSKYNPISDLLGESSGITYEPDLIAIGANNTADAASMLIEYGYIYESQFTNPALRDLTLKDLAFQTYLGLQDFFDPSNAISLAKSYDTLVLPHEWRSLIDVRSNSSRDVFALQTAFISDGLYPPVPKDLNDCPRTGTLGPCTKAALSEFQKKYGITGENGIVGPRTLEILNQTFGVRVN